MNIKPTAAALALAAVLAAPAAAEYLAYSVTEAAKSPLPESLDQIDAKHLVNLEWGAYEGKRSRVGVLGVQNTSTVASVSVGALGDVSVSGGQVPVSGIEAIIMDTMARTGRFTVVERKILDDVLGEQDLGDRAAQPSAAKVGNVLGAQYLLQGVVTDYEDKTSSTGGGVGAGAVGGLLGGRTGLPMLGGVGIKNSEGRVGMNFRLVDSQTSEVVHTKQVESIIREGGLMLGGGLIGGGAGMGGFFGSYSKTPIGQAVIAAVNKGVFDLVKVVGARPAEGSIVRADAGRVWLNLGQGAVHAGDRLQVLRKGEELIDPETGISLGTEDTVIGAATVAQVQEKFSIANLDGSAQVERGDKVVSLEAPPTIEYAAAWSPPEEPKKKRRGLFRRNKKDK